MNDRWTTKDGARWNRAEKIRVARLFRHHVRTPSNPRGRIHRECCWFCVENARLGGYPRAEHLPLVPAHHIDYARPFVVVWCCDKHHRMLDHDSLKLPLRAIHDYTSLVEAPGVAKPGLRRTLVTMEMAERTLTATQANEAYKKTFESGIVELLKKRTCPF